MEKKLTAGVKVQGKEALVVATHEVTGIADSEEEDGFGITLGTKTEHTVVAATNQGEKIVSSKASVQIKNEPSVISKLKAKLHKCMTYMASAKMTLKAGIRDAPDSVEGQMITKKLGEAPEKIQDMLDMYEVFTDWQHGDLVELKKKLMKDCEHVNCFLSTFRALS